MRQQGQKLNSEEKAELLKRVVEMRATGYSLTAIAKELDTRYETVKKLWDGYLGTTPPIDKPQTLKERSIQAEAALLKALRAFHSGKGTVRDVLAAFEAADKYSGLDEYIKSLQPAAELPPILEMEIANVDIELPPDDDD